jgi:hypothetical protein
MFVYYSRALRSREILRWVWCCAGEYSTLYPKTNRAKCTLNERSVSKSAHELNCTSLKMYFTSPHNIQWIFVTYLLLRLMSFILVHAQACSSTWRTQGDGGSRADVEQSLHCHDWTTDDWWWSQTAMRKLCGSFPTDTEVCFNAHASNGLILAQSNSFHLCSLYLMWLNLHNSCKYTQYISFTYWCWDVWFDLLFWVCL